MKFTRSVVFKFIEWTVFLLQCSFIVTVNGEATLTAASMLFRHGDRSPLRTYPLDPHRKHKWLGGFGALSAKGARQMYESGALKSLRYSRLLHLECEVPPCEKISSKLVVQSSRVTRCVASARFFLMGLLGARISEDLIDVLSAGEDEMLAPDGKRCPQYDNPEELSPDFKDPRFADIIDFQSDEGKEFITYLENNSGLTMNTTTELFKFFDTLLIQSDNQLGLPEWTEKVFERYIKPLSNAFFDLYSNLSLVKIRSGTLLKDILSRFGNFTEEISSKNLLIYSAHDITICGMLHLLEIRNQTVPRAAYGASLNLELYKNTDLTDDHEIRIFYFKNHADESPIQVMIPSCETPCPLKKFVKYFKPKFAIKYEEECSM